MNDPRKYNICVRFCEEAGDEMYCATVKELPDVAVYEDTAEAAYDGAVGVVADMQEMFSKKGKAFPAPSIGTVEASGRITLRMSRSLHQRASEAAAADDISLNQWLVESAAWRLDGSRTAVIHAPHAVSVTCNTGTAQAAIFFPGGQIKTTTPVATEEPATIIRREQIQIA